MAKVVEVAPAVEALPTLSSIAPPDGTGKGQGQGAIPLHDAAQNNRPDEVRRLLAARADVEVKEPAFGWRALHVAAGSGAGLAVEVLLECRASAEVLANDGETPLHLAAGEGQAKVIRKLIEGRASINCLNADGETPLHVAVQQGIDKPSLTHVKALVELRADLSLRDKGGRSAYETAGLYAKNLEKAEELRAVLGGGTAKTDPEDPWPDVVGELDDGVEAITAAEALRELGNKRFKEQRFEDAVKAYFKAKRFLPTGPAQFDPIAEGDAEGARARACAIAVSSNAAFCKLKLGEYEVCANMCDGVLTVDPKNVKAYYRKGLALRAQGQEEEAEGAFRKALELDPKDVAVQKELAAMAAQKKQEKEKEKRLARKMFG